MPLALALRVDIIVGVLVSGVFSTAKVLLTRWRVFGKEEIRYSLI